MHTIITMAILCFLSLSISARFQTVNLIRDGNFSFAKIDFIHFY